MRFEDTDVFPNQDVATLKTGDLEGCKASSFSPFRGLSGRRFAGGTNGMASLTTRTRPISAPRSARPCWRARSRRGLECDLDVQALQHENVTLTEHMSAIIALICLNDKP